ncbi:hypothetical protein ACWFNE_00980 [Cellulomonas sp. NPDC055163]
MGRFSAVRDNAQAERREPPAAPPRQVRPSGTLAPSTRAPGVLALQRAAGNAATSALLHRDASGGGLQAPQVQRAAVADYMKTDPSQVTDAQLDATDEFKAYIASSTPAKKVSPEDARLALRLLLRYLNALSPGTVFGPHDLDGWLRTAQARSKVAGTAEGAVGTGEWVGLSPVDVRGPTTSGSDFMQWMLGGGSVPAVKTVKGNCWEMVMFSAFRAGQLSEARMREIYTKGQAADKARGGLAFPETVEAELRSGSEFVYDPAKAGSPRPLRGDVVIFSSAAGHVALATGRLVGGQVEIISHWGPPHHNLKIETTTVEDLLKNGAKAPVKFWSPRW